jgi:tetrahydromethanopterin S-methyltransferase subunit G
MSTSVPPPAGGPRRSAVGTPATSVSGSVAPTIREAAREGYDAPRAPLESEDGRSIGELLSSVTTNVSTLLRQEVALAKAELRQSGQRAGKGIGMFAGAAVAGLLLLVFVSVSAWWGLGQFIGNEWSALIVAVIWAIVAGILAAAGKKEFERIRGLPQTTETLGKVPNALKGHEEDNR